MNASGSTSVPVGAVTSHFALDARVIQRGYPETRMRAVFALSVDGSVTPFAPLIQLFRERGIDSVSTQQEMCWAMTLFLNFLSAYGTEVENSPTEALFSFARALRAGTTPGSCLERARFRWRELSHNRAARCLALVTRFTDWLSNRTGMLAPNAWRAATAAERVVLAKRFERRTASALLKHVAALRRDEATRITRTVAVHNERDDAPDGTVYAFDEKQFEKLVRRGFWRAVDQENAPLHERLRVRDLMITLLLHAGGLRLSEPFHLYVDDVTIDAHDPRAACVRVYHPERGAAPQEGARCWRNRADYLRERWGIEPRNRVKGRFRAGWKGLALSDQRKRYAQVHFFPAHYAHLFLELFRAYLIHRPRADDHPFLFVSDYAATKGEPYTIASFKSAHAAAVRRIGLVARKHLGTSPHGHRHAFGHALVEANTSRRDIQRALHHRDPSSQDAYTKPTAATVNANLKEASRRLFGDVAHPLTKEIDHD